MSMQSQFEREEDLLCEQVNNGTISQSEFNKTMREMGNEYRNQARESAQEAYDDEMGYW